MKTEFVITITHTKPIPELADLVTGRAWSIDGVTSAEHRPLPKSSLPIREMSEPRALPAAQDPLCPPCPGCGSRECNGRCAGDDLMGASS